MIEIKPDYVVGFVESELRDRDAAVHETLLGLHKLLAPALQDRMVAESYYEPAADGWRVVLHRIPYTPPAPSSPEEEEARRRLVLEEALNSPAGRAAAEAILERKALAELMTKPGGTAADDDPEDGLDAQIHADLAEGRI